jgi:hypothetical protein
MRADQRAVLDSIQTAPPLSAEEEWMIKRGYWPVCDISANVLRWERGEEIVMPSEVKGLIEAELRERRKWVTIEETLNELGY